MSSDLLREILRELAADQPSQPERAEQVVQRYHQERVRRGGMAILAVIVAAATLAGVVVHRG